MTGATKLSDFQDFQTEVETARLRNNSSRPCWMLRELINQSGGGPDQSGNSAIFQTMAKTAQLSRPRRRWRYQETRINSSRPKRKRRDFPDQGGEGLTFQTIAETARPRINSSRPRPRRCDFLDQSGYGATFQTKPETTQLFGLRRRRRDQDYIPHDLGGYGATFKIKVHTA